MEQAEQTAEHPLSAPDAVGVPAVASAAASVPVGDAQSAAVSANDAATSDVDVEDAGSEFFALRARLEEIAAAVSADDISLDDALDLYEEAAKLGAQATDALEGETTHGNVG